MYPTRNIRARPTTACTYASRNIERANELTRTIRVYGRSHSLRLTRLYQTASLSVFRIRFFRETFHFSFSNFLWIKFKGGLQMVGSTYRH